MIFKVKAPCVNRHSDTSKFRQSEKGKASAIIVFQETGTDKSDNTQISILQSQGFSV